MRKKTVLTLLFSILIFISVLTGLYLGLAEYYSNGFSYGTWVNGFYCTGMDVEEVNRLLKENFKETVLEVSFENGTNIKILLADISYKIDYEKPLQMLMNIQNPNFWILDMKKEKNNTMIPEVTYDEKVLEELLEKCLPADQMRSVEIIKTEQGYLLQNGKEHVLNKELMSAHIKNALEHGLYQIKIPENCYEDLPLTPDEEKLLALWEKIDTFQNCGIIYDMGDELVTVDASVVSNWITLTEEGKPYLDETGNLILDVRQVQKFIEELAEEFDTVGCDREFHATRGDTILVSGGTYGNKLDQQAEIDYLTEAFLTQKEECHIPQYVQTACRRGKEDIGDTYIEIDMTEQQMYYYVDGEIYEQTPIVTGNMVRNMSTPEGTCFVYAKQTNRILRGANYASFVNFWVPVRGNIGIHDAPWRNTYGEEIYKTNGSHGCINTPYEEMKKIYEHVEIGTPVVMFY